MSGSQAPASAVREPSHPVARRRGPSAAARLLSPVLVLAERVDRRRRHIRPVRRDGLLGVEFRRHAGASVRLRDGTLVRHGDRIAEVHLRNERVRAAAQARGWVAIFGARRDLDALLRWCARQLEPDRPVAVYGYSVLGAFLERGGFERRARPQTVRARLDAWFMRWLLGRFAPAGEARLAVGHAPLAVADYWLAVPRAPTRADAPPTTAVWRDEGAVADGLSPPRPPGEVLSASR